MGAGRMARVHANAIRAAGGTLVAVHDVVEMAAKSLASDTSASVATSVEEALHHPDVHAVLVVTSSDTHVDCIIQAVKAGMAVMCESRWRRVCQMRSGASTFWVPKKARSFWRSIGVSIRGMQRSRRRSRPVKSATSSN